MASTASRMGLSGKFSLGSLFFPFLPIPFAKRKLLDAFKYPRLSHVGFVYAFLVFIHGFSCVGLGRKFLVYRMGCVKQWLSMFQPVNKCLQIILVMNSYAWNLAVASLGWVTPGAATEGVTPLFFPAKPGNLFCSSLSLSLSLFIAFTRVSPLQCVTPHLFYLSGLVSPLFFVNLPTQFFSFGCHFLGGCHPGRSPPPPSDATEIWDSDAICHRNLLSHLL